MHPYLEYIMAQQRAEQLSRQTEHSRLSRRIRRKTMGPSTLQVLRWLGFGPARSLAKTGPSGMSTTTECTHGNCGHTCRTEDNIAYGIKR
jgi:hypothetical protein